MKGDRAELLPFLFDCLDTITEQLQLARSPSDRMAAIEVASGAVLVLLYRLSENGNEYVRAMFALSFKEFMFSPSCRDDWMNVANGPSAEFQAFLDNLIERCRDAKAAFEQLHTT